MRHPHQIALMDMLKERSLSIMTVRVACDCTIQRAKNLLGNHVDMTYAEYAALAHLAGLRLPMPAELPPNGQPLPQRLDSVYRAQQPKRVYQPVAEDMQIMGTIMRERLDLLASMPAIGPLDSKSTGCAWLEQAATQLWVAACHRDSDPLTMLTEFCTRMSLAVLARSAQKLGTKNLAALSRYAARHPDAFATPYDLIARFAPERVHALPAAQIMERWLVERGLDVQETADADA